MEEQNKLVVFESKEIRRIWHNEEWWFSILDIVEALTDTADPSQYFKRMRQRDEALKSYVGTNCTHVALEGKTGKKRQTTIGNTEHIFRIIQSIPSRKAEPFKQWLAKIGYERVQEIENPELAAERARGYYRDLGYSEDWIAKRMQSIEIRGQLTDEWKGRDVKEGLEYAILTAEISRATFGKTPSEYKKHKGLKRENLRDHMTNLELIFTMLGEETVKNETREVDAHGFEQNKKVARKGGQATGKALKTYEEETGQKVVTNKNFLHQVSEAKKANKLKKQEQKKLEGKKKKDKKQ
ncbi:MAG: Bro-N domain-containing protein [Saprospiraceae bacterium]